MAWPEGILVLKTFSVDCDPLGNASAAAAVAASESCHLTKLFFPFLHLPENSQVASLYFTKYVQAR